MTTKNVQTEGLGIWLTWYSNDLSRARPWFQSLGPLKKKEGKCVYYIYKYRFFYGQTALKAFGDLITADLACFIFI
jgi:hypothetical protein